MDEDLKLRINLPYSGGQYFYLESLDAELDRRNSESMVISARAIMFIDHPKTHSLDYWIRSKLDGNQNIVLGQPHRHLQQSRGSACE